ncbi:acyl-CoA desaturase [Chitinophaga sedimenti]|uniref:fatty acid desaturase family protein n=1 Tax=Chitinophaga sedimenti TaxID=2033606 RepID=UPI002003511D|nr:acyl-CoA desaturase [Chitinophaga sedimenti]MCK7557004.1 acyl-CoA desaturase [Chitinophaga sedimenti]
MSKVTFNNKNAVFFQSLKASVDAYFAETKQRKTGNWKLYHKTAVLIPAALAIYVSVLTVSMPPLLAIGLCAMLGLILASIGFNVMHDACHGSYSTRNWVNETLGLTLNALGGNSFIWKHKHNIIHHTYTNVDGVDDDIAKSPLMRHCQTQRWVPMHRIQHLYVPFMYAISSFAWVFGNDFQKYFARKVNTTPLKTMSTTDHVVFWLSKLLYVAFYIVVPLLFVSWQAWLVGFAAMHITLGFTLAVVFQLAHVVEETEFEVAGIEPTQIESEWAVHQIKTTSNFAPDNKIISWYVGGLNYQVEHHLFPRIAHIHYPALSKIVAEECRKHNLTYHCMPTMTSAVISHFKVIRMLGKKPALA